VHNERAVQLSIRLAAQAPEPPGVCRCACCRQAQNRQALQLQHLVHAGGQHRGPGRRDCAGALSHTRRKCPACTTQRTSGGVLLSARARASRLGEEPPRDSVSSQNLHKPQQVTVVPTEQARTQRVSLLFVDRGSGKGGAVCATHDEAGAARPPVCSLQSTRLAATAQGTRLASAAALAAAADLGPWAVGGLLEFRVCRVRGCAPSLPQHRCSLVEARVKGRQRLAASAFIVLQPAVGFRL
jgi:hypothetical protein